MMLRRWTWRAKPTPATPATTSTPSKTHFISRRMTVRSPRRLAAGHGRGLGRRESADDVGEIRVDRRPSGALHFAETHHHQVVRRHDHNHLAVIAGDRERRFGSARENLELARCGREVEPEVCAVDAIV